MTALAILGWVGFALMAWQAISAGRGWRRAIKGWEDALDGWRRVTDNFESFLKQLGQGGPPSDT